MAEKANVPEKATKPKIPANTDKLRKYVQMYIPAARPGEERQTYVSVNGRGMYVPRGKVISVPRYVADQIRHTLKLDAKYEREVAETHEKPLSEALR